MSVWEALGWLGNACYFLRFLVQWLRSEQAGRSVVPPSFWWLSLAGCVLLGGYAVREGALVLLPGFLINGAIYVRILWIDARGGSGSRLGPIPAAALGLAATVAIYVAGLFEPRDRLFESAAWLAVGIGGQIVWSSRFLVQWWYTESTGRNRFPAGFWWYTLAGSVLNILYTSRLGDAVLIASYAPTPLYPIRNLMLERRAARRDRGGPSGT